MLLRQQFLHLLTEITTFLTTHADVVADVERTDRPVSDKIRQYSGVLTKVGGGGRFERGPGGDRCGGQMIGQIRMMYWFCQF